MKFEDIVGKVFTKIEQEYDKIIFTVSDSERYIMYHGQDCCESVTIEDIDGDLNDLIGEPILYAEERTDSEEPAKDRWDESHTWTFYVIRNIKTTITIRWYGSSNGYYSESVSFERY